MNYDELPRSALIRLLEEHDEALRQAGKDGIVMNYSGRTAPWQIIRQVKPKLSIISKKLSCGEEAKQCENEIWDGENLSTMVSLYRHRGKVDLILTDPPYNTGSDFRYNDKWDQDPNDPDLGDLVAEDDGSRHSKWLKFMTPRIWMMKEMLRPGGVIAICIDHRELYRLGMLMDEIFDEENRLAIINWQKTAAPRPDKSHVSTSTEYVLVYAKDLAKTRTFSLGRSEQDNKRYSNPDDDPKNLWREGNLTARSASPKDEYGIQSPFTGEVHYPAGHGSWRHPKANIKGWLQEWGTTYEERDLGDGRAPALMVVGASSNKVSTAVSKKALSRLSKPNWPFVWFGRDGKGRPRVKTYLEGIKRGKVPVTYWAEEEDGYPVELDAASWGFKESGRTSDGVSELTSVVGPGHGFTTVKPLKLFKKLIQLWCPDGGLVLDPFAGSGTTGHAILHLNHETNASRRFIMIEQGNSDKKDHYAKTLTADRIRRVITGNWASGPQPALGGGFRFIQMKREKIDAGAVIALAREEMIDLLLNSYWDKSEKVRSYLHRYEIGAHKYLFATNPKNEGFFLIWDNPETPSVLNRDAFKAIMLEAEKAKLTERYHVYASIAPYTGAGVEFYKIPDRVLEHIGFNARADAYSNVVDEND
ncbi:site-specific DNA-methyltransferase (plasmid) [Rhodobacter xanthinilyticus]|uniref:site-specific DNA-methyltransferase (adenine-specific) n=1 Tax=Rhodobacter xanthinilyticus TaxID=1850250 RepID=A0A1D9MI09_9RHOB|nr:site-specific DNA-methyltransferase [Rhodobacter xanthinilyticus]AOZ71399.1 site-specific DNA-methyltransferase [Rhodobacter xanthinilyticus]